MSWAKPEEERQGEKGSLCGRDFRAVRRDGIRFATSLGSNLAVFRSLPRLGEESQGRTTEQRVVLEGTCLSC